MMLAEFQDPYKSAVIELIMELRSRGVRDRNVLVAIERIPRHMFVEKAFQDQAYADYALPIECGQTISQPFLVGYMTAKLEVGDRHKVLEIGTGSGYQTAILAQLARRVYTMERYRTLQREAERRFCELKLSNYTAMIGDGLKGWPSQAPFDRIMVTAAAPKIPEALIDQLKNDGILVMPVGAPHETQNLVKLTKQNGQIATEILSPVRFVPLVPGVAQQT